MDTLGPQPGSPSPATGETTDLSAREIVPDNPSIADELRRVADGDALARAWLYDTFSAGLFRRLRARYAMSPGVDPEELLHDLFIACFQHDARVLRRFLERVPTDEQRRARLEIYLWGLACGLASNRRRSWRRRRSVSLDDVASQLAAPDEESHHVEDDLLTRLALCLRTGGTRVYLYYKLRFVDGFTPEEVSRVTGWSRRATYKLRHQLNDVLDRCLKRLRIGTDAS